MGKFTIIIIITAIVFVLIGGGYFVFSNFFSSEPPPEEEVPTEPPPTPEVAPTTPPAPPKESTPSPPTEPTVPSLQEKVVDFGQAVAGVLASGESQEVTLVFTEAEVNEQAARLLAQVAIPEDIPLEIKSVHIDLQPGNNLFTKAETTILGLGVTLKVNSQVSIREGKPKVDITKVSFGVIPIPGTVKDRIVDFLTQKIDELIIQLTEPEIGGKGVELEFKDISIQEDEMTITVIVKPRA